MAKYKAHIQYKNSDGVRVPGVTTILGVLNKPALVKWANNLGLKGIDSNKYRDGMANIGTLAHLMIQGHLSGSKQDYSDYSKADIEKAENCLLSFYEWEKINKIEPIFLEEPFVDNGFDFGGTIDCYCKLNGTLTLIDFKTGKALYPEMMYQVAAYQTLLITNKKSVKQVRILRIGRDENEGFEDRLCKNLDYCWDIFYHCLEIYKTKKKIKDGSDDFYNFTRKVKK